MTPDEMLAHLKEHAPRQRVTLDAVFAVCQEQIERGVADFSFATIARMGTGRGVPKVQSIRNKTGENYRMLIPIGRRPSMSLIGYLSSVF